MSTQLDQMDLKSEVTQIMEALFTLPAEKVTAVRDYVWFLKTQYGHPSVVDVSDVWSVQDMAELVAATVAHAEHTFWAADDDDQTW